MSDMSERDAADGSRSHDAQRPESAADAPLPAFGRRSRSTPGLSSLAEERVLVERARTGDGDAIGRLYDHYVASLYRFCLARVGNETDAEDLTEEIFLKVMRSIAQFQWRPLPERPARGRAPGPGGTRFGVDEDEAPPRAQRALSADSRQAPRSAGSASPAPSPSPVPIERALSRVEGGAEGRPEPTSPFRAWLFRIARNHVVSHYRREAVRTTSGEVPEWMPDAGRGPEELAEMQLTIEEVFALVDQLPPAQRDVIRLRFGAGLSVQETAEALDKQPTNIKVLQHKGVKRLKEMLLGAPAIAREE